MVWFSGQLLLVSLNDIHNINFHWFVFAFNPNKFVLIFPTLAPNKHLDVEISLHNFFSVQKIFEALYHNWSLQKSLSEDLEFYIVFL